MVTEVISDTHIYQNKLEYFIKLLIWWICWLGGVWVLQAAQTGAGSAFFVFSLSQLMEFAPQILNKKYTGSCLFHGLFCIIITTVLLISIALLFGKEHTPECHKTMHGLSLASLIYMSIDWFMLLVWPTQDNGTNSHAENVSGTTVIDKFEESLHSGSLGNVKKGN